MKKSNKKGNAKKSAEDERKKLLRHRALDKTRNLKTRFEEIEDIQSYADQLNEEELEFLIAFTEEYVCANFKHKYEKLHTDKSERKMCYDRNNARNRCVFTRQKAQGVKNMDYLEEMEFFQENGYINSNRLPNTENGGLEELVDALMYLKEKEED